MRKHGSQNQRHLLCPQEIRLSLRDPPDPHVVDGVWPLHELLFDGGGEGPPHEAAQVVHSLWTEWLALLAGSAGLLFEESFDLPRGDVCGPHLRDIVAQQMTSDRAVGLVEGGSAAPDLLQPPFEDVADG